MSKNDTNKPCQKGSKTNNIFLKGGFYFLRCNITNSYFDIKIKLQYIVIVCYLVLLDIICVNLPTKMFHKIILFEIVSKLLASLVRNNFPKRLSDAPLHTLSEF